MFDFVMGLLSEFEPICVQLLGRPTLPTLAETLSALIAEETRLRTIAANLPVSQHSVLAIAPLSIQAAASAPATSRGIPCSHCGPTNHPDARCFKKYTHLLAEVKTKRAASRRGTAATFSDRTQAAPPPQQQSSSLSAPVSAYMSASSLSSASHSGTTCWVLDSGASFHMTSNSSHLDSCHPIIDIRSVQTADVNFCTVTH